MGASAAWRLTPAASPTLAAAKASSGRSWPYPSPTGRLPDAPVYVLHVGDRAVVMGKDNLICSLRQLVTTVLAAGDPCLGTTRAGGEKPGTCHMTAPVILTRARPDTARPS